MRRVYTYYVKFKAIPKYMFLLFIVLGFNVAQAQRSGKIMGSVSDTSTGDPLYGANVFLEGTSLGAATSIDGKFMITQAAPGKYTMIVRYIGYRGKKIPITVQEGKTLEINVKLQYATIESKEVVITAQAKGQTEAINQQLSSNTISNVVSAERIQDIPDANAAESVGRLPGISVIRSGGEGQKVTIRGMAPQYNVIMVNGVRLQSTDPSNRSVDLNMVAPNILSGIKVTKALTADMDADAVGGTVDLEIGKAREGFHSSFSAQDGYASLANVKPFGNYRVTGLITNRFLDDKLGLQVSGYLDKFNRNSDELTAGYATNAESITVNGLIPTELASTSIIDNVTNRKRAGGSLVLDYELPNGSLILNNFIGSLHETQIQQQNELKLAGNAWTAYAKSNDFTNTVISNALQGKFDFNVIQMDFSLANSFTKQYAPGDITMNMQMYQDVTGFTTPSINDPTKASPSQLLNAAVINSSQEIVHNLYTLQRTIHETAQSAVLNFKIPYNFSQDVSGDIKFGGKYVRNTRYNNEDQWYNQPDRVLFGGDFVDSMRTKYWTNLGIQASDNGLKAALFADPSYDIGNFLSGHEGVSRFYYLTSIPKMQYYEYLSKIHNVYPMDPKASTQNDFNYTRNLYAFYLESEIKIGNYITLFPGIRYEKFGFNYNAKEVVQFAPIMNVNDHYFDVTPVHWDSTKGENWFPQMQVRIKPTGWLDIRLASTRSIIYPDYNAVSPYLFAVTYTSPTLTLGNPYLQPAIAQNYDVYASVYENYIGLFTAGFFYKSIDNFIVPIKYFTENDSLIHYRFNLTPTQRTTINTWTNLTKTSYVRGFELDWQTHFWYLPSFLSGIVFNINYTHINSSTRYPYFKAEKIGSGLIKKTIYVDTTRTGRLIDQPDDILNMTIGYDIGGFSARLSFQYTNNVLKSANPVYQELDSYTAPYSRWDFTAYQKLPWLEGLQIYLDINNITNRPDRRFASVLEKLSDVQYYGRTADLGVRYSF